MPKRILILTGSVGAGHDNAARELKRKLEDRGAVVNVRDYIDALPFALKYIIKDKYSTTMQNVPWLFNALFKLLEYSWIQYILNIIVIWPSQGKVRMWATEFKFDAVVSTYPVSSQALGWLRSRNALHINTFTYITDPAVHRTWFHHGIDLHLTPYPEAVAEAARRYRIDVQLVDSLVALKFSAPIHDFESVRSRIRQDLSIPIEGRVVLIVAGSLGLGRVYETVSVIQQRPRTHALVLCGSNEKLKAKLLTENRVVALGWRDDVPDLHIAADVLVHNAGGLSFAEAVVRGLPTITYLPISGHGEANARMLEKWGISPWPKTPDQLRKAIGTAVRNSCKSGFGDCDTAKYVLETE
jgi:UDP-N-acetylglucosamine:LPS N-acetylglucosamine transferase